MKRQKYICLALAALLGPGVVQADEKVSINSVPTMNEVVVTATKTEEKRKDISNSVILIDDVAIDETPARSLGQLLDGEAGVDWRTRGNYGGAAHEIQIRGMDSDETQVMVNGTIINSPSLGRADINGVPLNNIAKIEVIKGSGSLLYGSGAMAGIVNVLTKRPERDVTALRIQGGYGTQDSYRIAFEHGMFVTQNFGHYFTTNFSETDGFRDNSDLTQNDISLKLVYDRGALLDISLYGDYLDRSFGVPGIRPPAETQDYYVNGVRFYSAESASTLNNGESEDGHVILHVKSAPRDWLKLRGKADYSLIKTIDTERFNADYIGDLAEEGRRTTITNDVKGIEGNAEFIPLTHASLLLGIDYKHHDWDTETVDLDTTGTDKPGAPVENQASLHTTGLYGELQYRPIQYAKLLAGIRQEKHSTFGRENIPHFGLVVNPLAHTAFKLNHGKFFKAPTPNDLFWPESAWARGNPDLLPQTGWHSDISIEQSLYEDRIFGFLTYFEWDIEGKITWAVNPAFGKWTPSNMNKGEGKGWEAGLEFNPSYNYFLALSYTYTDAQEETSPGQWRDAQYLAKNRFKAKFTWRSEFGTTASAVVRYVSDRDFYRTTADTMPTDILPSYTITDLKVEQRLQDNWLMTLDAGNIFDTDYDTYVGSFVDMNGTLQFGTYPGAGRSFFLSVTYEL